MRFLFAYRLRPALLAGAVLALSPAFAGALENPIPYAEAWRTTRSSGPALAPVAQANAAARPSASASDPTPARKATAPSPSRRVWASPVAGLSGYRQPAILPTDCRLVSSARRDCTIPGGTFGRYRITATGKSRPYGRRPRQQLTIIAANRNCAQVADARPWGEGQRAITAVCELSILSDTPVLISIIYADADALKEPGGPAVVIEAVAWTGVLDMRDASAPPR